MSLHKRFITLSRGVILTMVYYYGILTPEIVCTVVIRQWQTLELHDMARLMVIDKFYSTGVHVIKLFSM